ncbi:RNA polymerase II elongation factor [Tulasnella sp. JGI-2019a]|nr:RNA polymerase II elongation factor [Tulasnella sp. JGI-2019a]KAG9000168.1 RNA polymerase II elongation factor [Tulasnella sp. JGI-2019a]
MAEASVVLDSLKDHVKKLQAAIQGRHFQEAANVLRALKKVNATEELLRATKAGVIVSKVRTCEDTTVSQLSKEVVTKWKNEVDEIKKKRSAATVGTPKAGTPSGSNTNGATTPTTNPESGSVTPASKPVTKKLDTSSKPPAVPAPSASRSPTVVKAPSTPVSGGAGLAPTDLRSVKKDGIKLGTTGDKTRDKCLEMVYDAIVFDSNAPAEQILARSKSIEQSCFDEFGSANNDYRAKIRRLFLNLKDKNNPSLRGAVVSGDLSVKRFCSMTNQEMASEERKQANELLDAQNLFNTLAAAEQEAETDAFQCGRCKQRKTRYRQQQTRSADEPMTTFVTCTYCGNRWKFC